MVYRKDGVLWLLESMSHLPELRLGALVRIPETAIWRKGVPVCILRFSGNRMHKLRTEKMTTRFVQMNFLHDSKHGGTHESRISMSSSKSVQPQGMAVNSFRRLSLRSSSVLTKILMAKNEELNKEAFKVLIRLREPDDQDSRKEKVVTEPLTDKAYANVITKWSMKELRRIVSMQEYIRVSGDRPLVFRIAYSAPLQAKSRTSAINYSAAPDPEPKVESKFKTAANRELESRVAICKEICRRICVLLASHKNVEVLEMKTEFMTTDHEYWLEDAWDIIWRTKPVERVEKVDENEFHVMNQTARNELVKRLDQHGEDLLKDKRREAVMETMCQAINDHVADMRETTGVNGELAPEPLDGRSDCAFGKLRPSCPFKMTELLDTHYIGRQSKALYHRG